MKTHSICLYIEEGKRYTGCNLTTTEWFECAIIGVCAVIRSNTVVLFYQNVTLNLDAAQEVSSVQHRSNTQQGIAGDTNTLSQDYLVWANTDLVKFMTYNSYVSEDTKSL